jgi:putative oxidoreductase
MSKTRTIFLWIAIVLGVLVYAAAGTAKLLGADMEVQTFLRFGMSLTFMRLIGACELAGAIGLLIPRFTTWAALGLMIVMGGAIVSHLRFDGIPPAVPAVVLMALMGYAGWQRRHSALGLTKR